MLRESNASSPLVGDKNNGETSSRLRFHSTPVRTVNYPKCPPSIALIARQLRDMLPFSSPISKNELLDSGLTEQLEASAISNSSSTASKMTQGSSLARQHSTYSELYSPESASHLNIPSTPSLECTSLNRGLESNVLPTWQEEPNYIYDSTTRRTYYKGEYLGKGGFARVHELEDVASGKVYAGKIIPKSRITKPRHKEKINREIELHRKFVHENVVRFYHCFEDEANVYIVLENCSRKSLAHLMKQRKTLTEPEVRIYLRQVVDGLRYLHQQNIVHRDIKLGNMLLTEDWKVKICDFGLASPFDPDARVSICGTPNYIAPEVLEREAHGFEADIWALGCIMYAMLVGQPPFETSTLEETYSRIAGNMYEIPRWISRPARSLIRKLLAPDPCHRPTLDEITSHEFFACEVMSSSMPRSSTGNVSNPNDSGFRSDFDSTNENASPTVNNVRVPYHARAFTTSIRTKNDSFVNVNCSKQQRVQQPSQVFKEAPSSRAAKQTPPVPRVPLPSFDVFKPKAEALFVNHEEDEQKGARNRATSQQRFQATDMPVKSLSLRAALDFCLQTSQLTANNPYPALFQPIFVSKWIDYSNKHGFGFQLSNGYVGILFNDCCRIGYSERQNCFEFQDETGQMSVYSTDSLPDHLSDRLTLLSYFVRYMDENMMDGCGSQSTSSSPASHPSSAQTNQLFAAHMKRWIRTPEAIIMQLNDDTLQINFFKDHTKIVLSSSVGACETTQFWVTYINSERSSSTYRMTDIAAHGCDGVLRERLVYALNVLREFEELDEEK